MAKALPPMQLPAQNTQKRFVASEGQSTSDGPGEHRNKREARRADQPPKKRHENPEQSQRAQDNAYDRSEGRQQTEGGDTEQQPKHAQSSMKVIRSAH